MGYGHRFRPWADLPDVVLHEIAVNITSPFAYSAFAGVCRSWRSISKSSKSAFIASQPPLLLTLSENRSIVRFYSLAEDRFYSSEHPIMPAVFRNFKYLGHNYGYLIMVKLSTDNPIPFIINLRTGIRMNFPSIHTWLIAGRLASSPFNSSESCLLILHGNHHVYFCKLGGSNWHEVAYDSCIDNIAILNNHLYIKFEKTIRVIDYTDHLHPVQLQVVELPEPPSNSCWLSLMELDRKLVLISWTEARLGIARISCYQLEICEKKTGGTTTCWSMRELGSRRVFDDGQIASITDARMTKIEGSIYCVNPVTNMVNIFAWLSNGSKAKNIKFKDGRSVRIWIHPSSWEEWGLSF